MKLYHFACVHSAAGIDGDGGLIRPNRHPLLGVDVVWMTADPSASAVALGLASHTIITCDRMAVRYVIDTPRDANPWSDLRAMLPVNLARTFEAARGTRPGAWWVSTVPQSARRG